jgi:hypothetical protein
MTGRDVAILIFAVAYGAGGVALYRRRGFLVKQARYHVGALLLYVCTFLLVLHFTERGTTALVIAMLIYAVVLQRFRPKHSRYISRRDRRKVIARFERSGERYDPKKHEIDHVVPHSRGGMSTADNLKVIAKATNRSKSAKSPWWDVLGK